ncbi:hypothetical protein MD484_g8586, partial [Candolleomyces efflorescens]
MVQRRLTDLSSLSAERLSHLVSHLLDYRLLDVLCSIKIGLQPSGQLERLPIPLPPKIFYKSAANWTTMVLHGIQALREGAHEDRAPHNSSLGSTATQAPLEDSHCNASLNPTATIFTSLVRRQDTIERHKILANFECAAAYLSLTLKGITDLPNTVPEFKTLVYKVCQLSHERWETFFSSIKSVHSFKLPLHFALATSIACLFLPSNLMTKDLSRLVLIQGLGGARPAQLQQIEEILWRALFDISQGRHPLEARLRSAFCEVGNVDLSGIGFPDSEWLRAEPKFEELLNDIEASSSPAHPQSAGVTPLQDANPQQVQACQRTTRSATARLVKSRAVVGTLPAPVPNPAYLATTSTPQRKKKKRVTTRAPSEGPGPSRPTTPAPQKRKLEDLRPFENSPSKVMKLEGGSRQIVYELFDLSDEKVAVPRFFSLFRRSPNSKTTPIIDLTLDESPSFATETCPLWDDQKSIDFVATFHNRMQRSILVLTKPPEAKYSFDETSLRSFAMLNKPVPVQDFSIAPELDRTAFGTMSQLVESAKGQGKPLAASSFPMPNGPSPFPSLASDVHAWDMTIDLAWCGRRWEMPRSELRWAEVLTKNTYQSMRFSPNGFGTQIEVKGGSQLLVICQPAQFNPYNISSVPLLDRIQNELFIEEWQTLTYNAFHLQPGHIV